MVVKDTSPNNDSLSTEKDSTHSEEINNLKSPESCDKNSNQISGTRELLKRVREAAEEKLAFAYNKTSSVPNSSKIVLKGPESPAWHGSLTKIKLKPRSSNSIITNTANPRNATSTSKTTIPKIADNTAATRSLYNYFVKVRGEYEDFREIEAVRLQRRLEKLSDFPKGSKSDKFEEFEKEIVPWQADSSTKHCFLCLQQFSLLIRRHHCRLCGRIICSNCDSSIPIKLQDASVKDLNSCTKCFKFLFKSKQPISQQFCRKGPFEKKMDSLFKKIKNLKEQLMETIPKFNEYLMEESVTEARPLKDWRRDAWTLRDTLILYSVHFRSTIQELCEIIEQESLEFPIYKVLAGNLRRAGNEFLQKHMFTLQILDMTDTQQDTKDTKDIRDIDRNTTISTESKSGRPTSVISNFIKSIPLIFTDDHSDLSFLEFYTPEGDLIPLKDPKTIKLALNNQESVLREQLGQLEGEFERSGDSLGLRAAIEEIKIELEKVQRAK